MSKETDNWTGCYEGGWQGLIVPEAFAHPAKFSYNLTERMIGHAIKNGWIKRGSVVVDPFGGVGCGGIVAAYSDLVWIGVELEEKFCRLASDYDCPGISKKEWVRWFGRFDKNKDICPNCQSDIQQWYERNSGIIPSREAHHFIGNFEFHRRKWEKLGCTQPVIIQGDSRKLCEVIAGADCVISSPPYATGSIAKNSSGIDRKKQWETYRSQGGGLSYEGFVAQQEKHSQEYGKSSGQLQNMKPGNIDMVVSSPPYVSGGHHPDQTGAWGGKAQSVPKELAGYGDTPGQLGSMKPGQVDAVISSPPFQESVGVGRQFEKLKKKFNSNTDNADKPWHRSNTNKSYTSASVTGDYGQTPGNLGNLKPGDVDCVVSSPPYEGCQQVDNRKTFNKCHTEQASHLGWGTQSSENNLGQEQGPTFWQAAREIVQQCHQILKPGGMAIFVTKSFVRKGAIVDFPGDWQRLCESVGFETVCKHKAMLVKETTHNGLFEQISEKKERKSFFRRLAESKGSPRIDWEMVLCMRAIK